VKGGKKVTFTSAGQTVAKLTSNDQDEFDDWSKTKGQTLARANLRLSARTVSVTSRPVVGASQMHVSVDGVSDLEPLRELLYIPSFLLWLGKSLR